MRFVLAAFVFMLGLNDSVLAQWPTRSWTVLEESTSKKKTTKNEKRPVGERKRFAEKYEESLQHASFWFESMSFDAPRQLNDKGRLEFKGDERYVAYLLRDSSIRGSSHDADGYMELSTHPGFIDPEGSLDELFTAAAVHELFHGIQQANPNYRKYTSSRPGSDRPNICGSEATRTDQWLTEGTATAVQIQYLERTYGYAYGHPFKGSDRANWVRFFDQSLDWGRLDPEYHDPSQSWIEQLSWKCTYGSWYFWYAVGNMLASKEPRDGRRTAYLRHIFEQEGPWEETGVAMVDAGLKKAAQELDSIAPYHGGLFALYPQFVAQYLDVDRFFENVQHVTMGTPSLYETTSSLEGGPIDPIGTRAWRFRIQLPPEMTSMPYTVRFVVESPDQTSMDGLHLIVNGKVIDRSDDPNTPYSHTRRTDEDVPNAEGEYEYFVRIANVSPEAVETLPAEFSLRVEVEGFYGETPRGPSIDSIAGELSPGFEIRGPGKYWTCSGGDDARASFAIITPDGHAKQLERLLPQGFQNIESDFDRAELEAHKKGDMEELKEIQQKRKEFQESMQLAADRSNSRDNIAQAADESRRTNETTIMAKLYGTNADGSCSVVLTATLPGREAAAQKISGEDFDVMVTPEVRADAMASIMNFAATLDMSNFDPANMADGAFVSQAQQLMQNPLIELEEDPNSEWTLCVENERDCDIGALRLEHADYDHLSGTFKFQVSRLIEGTNKTEYDTVTGLFNITSTQTENDNSLVDFMSRGQQIGEPLYLPGMENLLQGGSMFGE